MTTITVLALQKNCSKSHKKERPEGKALRRTRKMDIEGADVTCWGRLFQVQAAATGKARSPTVDSRVRRTFSVTEEVDLRCLRASKSAVYSSSSANLFYVSMLWDQALSTVIPLWLGEWVLEVITGSTCLHWTVYLISSPTARHLSPSRNVSRLTYSAFIFEHDSDFWLCKVLF